MTTPQQASRPSGWTCDHMTITGGDAQAWEEITGPCGCLMAPFYGGDPAAISPVTQSDAGTTLTDSRNGATT